MFRKVLGALPVGVLFGVLSLGRASAQAPATLPPGPVPVVPNAPVINGPVRPVLPPPTSGPAAPVGVAPSAPISGPPPVPPPPGPPPAPVYPRYEDRNGPLLQGDPLLDRLPAPGWFAAVDVDVVGVHVKNRLFAPLTFPNRVTSELHLPGAELDWTGAPRLTLGYRLDQGAGEFLVSYRSLVTDGKADTFDARGDTGLLKSRLNLNAVDLDYGSWENSLGPLWDMEWRVGLRVATVYYDTRVNMDLVRPFPEMPGAFDARTNNNFWGLGPHAALRLSRHLGIRGFFLYAGLEGAVLIGRNSQSFEEVFTGSFIPGGSVGSANRLSGTQAVPMLNFETGVGWTPPGHDHVRFTFGYQIENWWQLGKLADSQLELLDQGVFFRSEFNF
jgi:hypothetical protein